MSVVFGTAPDSWGVWHPYHPKQPPWARFLDEAAEAGYEFVELGPFGYLPRDPASLGDELDRRGLQLIAGTLIDDYHRDDRRDAILEETRAICELVSYLGAKFLVVIPDIDDAMDGSTAHRRRLDQDSWNRLAATVTDVGRIAREEYGLTATFHPHADSAVETSVEIVRLLQDTPPAVVQLCFDTGHVEYRDGDSVAMFDEYSSRIPYLHLKSVSPRIKRRVSEERIDFAAAVQLGVMCEPDAGTVDFPALAKAMKRVGWRGWAVVEQDMFPLDDHAAALPIAVRSRAYFESLGWSTNLQSAKTSE